MTPATTHECPAPGCDEQVPSSRLACKPHWYRIPIDIRNRLLREYSNNFGETSYFEARAACLRALGVSEHEIASLNGGVV